MQSISNILRTLKNHIVQLSECLNERTQEYSIFVCFIYSFCVPCIVSVWIDLFFGWFFVCFKFSFCISFCRVFFFLLVFVFFPCFALFAYIMWIFFGIIELWKFAVNCKCACLCDRLTFKMSLNIYKYISIKFSRRIHFEVWNS